MLGTTSPHPDRSRLTARIRWSQAPKTAPTTDWVSVDLYQSEVAGIAEGERPGDEGEDVRGDRRGDTSLEGDERGPLGGDEPLEPMRVEALTRPPRQGVVRENPLADDGDPATVPSAVPESEEVIPVNAVSTWVLPSGVAVGR